MSLCIHEILSYPHKRERDVTVSYPRKREMLLAAFPQKRERDVTGSFTTYQRLPTKS